MSCFAIARQPIVDTNLRVTAYELFFRASGEREARLDASSADQASSRLMLSGFVDGGSDDIVEGKLAFINVTPEVLASGTAAILPREKVVLETPFHQRERLDPALAARVVGEGFRLALDNFIWHDAADAVLPHVSYIKFNIRELSREQLRGVMVRLARHNHLTIIATRVETRDEFEFCRSLGMTGFQGYFLCRPTIVARRDLPGARMGAMRLLSEIWQTDVSLPKLEPLVRHDATLAYRLLRVANSPFYNRGSTIRSIKHALAMLGLEGTRQWASLLAMSQIDDKPHELLAISLIRARMCESLGRIAGDRDPEGFFLVGLLSVLDALLDQSMTELVERLSLSQAISDALLHYASPEAGGLRGQALACVLAQENGVWEQANFTPATRDEVQQSYLEAIRWSRSVGGFL